MTPDFLLGHELAVTVDTDIGHPVGVATLVDQEVDLQQEGFPADGTGVILPGGVSLAGRWPAHAGLLLLPWAGICLFHRSADIWCHLLSWFFRNVGHQILASIS